MDWTFLHLASSVLLVEKVQAVYASGVIELLTQYDTVSSFDEVCSFEMKAMFLLVWKPEQGCLGLVILWP